MADKRLNREQFFGKLANMDDAAVRKALWTVYWRGSAPTREKVEAAIDPQIAAIRNENAKDAPDAQAVLIDVKEFAELARAGAYLAGDRRVSPKERTRWRLTFRQLAAEAREALRGDDIDAAIKALSILIDVACEAKDVEYFRSQDPVDAARFVVSDAVEAIWTTVLRMSGFTEFARRAVEHLVRWESRYGWTRFGFGWVSEHERSLAEVATGLVPLPDSWGDFADQYLRYLDDAAGSARAESVRRRTVELREWHEIVLGRLFGGEFEDRLDRIVAHPEITRTERTYLRDRLAEVRR